MGLIPINTEFLKTFFGDELGLKCYTCGRSFKDEKDFMAHEHKEEA